MPRILDTITGPADLRKIPQADLAALAAEIRGEILATVSKNGGHLASSLGAVELIIALHYAFKTPEDRIVWDVGHQTYAHKLLTGRRDRFPTIRQLGGLSGFPNKDESPVYDLFTCGHSSTSISTALGLVMARDLAGTKEKVIAVTGDASLAGGMAFEALNHGGQAHKDLIVILNDNERSISQPVGALSKYLNRIIANPVYNRVRKDVEKLVKRIPRLGFRAYRAARKLEEGLKNLLIPGMLFEELGFRYFGPIDGHNIDELVATFRNLMDLNEPILIHVVTRKGKGYPPAEADPGSFHGTGPFDLSTGTKRPSRDEKTFTAACGEALSALAENDDRIVAISAAMVDGTGLAPFAQKHPGRFYDVGIAEEHAVGLAAGLARGGFRPVVAIYSTFLQRGYDQIIHDVCLQRLPVVFCLDRAGLVGEDGPTHHGVFDIPYLRHIPNLTVMAPATPEELRQMLAFAVTVDGPVAIRYPKGGAASRATAPAPVAMGAAEVVREGKGVVIIALGSMLEVADRGAALLEKARIYPTVVNARFVKPLDEALIARLASSAKLIVTMEEGVAAGGFGAAVLESLGRAGHQGVTVRRLALPDRFIEHGSRQALFAKYNLTPEGLCAIIKNESGG